MDRINGSQINMLCRHTFSEPPLLPAMLFFTTKPHIGLWHYMGHCGEKYGGQLTRIPLLMLVCWQWKNPASAAMVTGVGVVYQVNGSYCWSGSITPGCQDSSSPLAAAQRCLVLMLALQATHLHGSNFIAWSKPSQNHAADVLCVFYVF